jgi:hypothetical protein
MIYKTALLFFICLALAFQANAQVEMGDSLFSSTHRDKVKIDFLASYYEQDGIHSPVTGGEGTEKLEDIVGKIKVYIPMKKGKSLTLGLAADSYTSASTDMINDAKSSASVQDTRTYGNIDFAQTDSSKKKTWGLGIGYSTEWDVNSVSVNATYTHLSRNENQAVKLSFSYFHDTWELIYPAELRSKSLRNPELFLSNNIRQLGNLGISFNQVVNKKMNASLSTEFIYQSGLLSTPFHRIYFKDTTDVRIEQLPNSRWKLPIALRFNAYISDLFVLKTFYRYYVDDFGIQAHTLKFEIPVKISNYLSLYPFVRMHSQTASQYFAPKFEHLSSQEFFTSDYDLSAFTSVKYGMGFKYEPLYGLGRMRLPSRQRKVLIWTHLSARYGHYNRSDGLHADIFSLMTSFEF